MGPGPHQGAGSASQEAREATRSRALRSRPPLQPGPGALGCRGDRRAAGQGDRTRAGGWPGQWPTRTHVCSCVCGVPGQCWSRGRWGVLHGPLSAAETLPVAGISVPRGLGVARPAPCGPVPVSCPGPGRPAPLPPWGPVHSVW